MKFVSLVILLLSLFSPPFLQLLLLCSCDSHKSHWGRTGHGNEATTRKSEPIAIPTLSTMSSRMPLNSVSLSSSTHPLVILCGSGNRFIFPNRFSNWSHHLPPRGFSSSCLIALSLPRSICMYHRVILYKKTVDMIFRAGNCLRDADQKRSFDHR